jgi:hypothetical protein
VLVVLAAVALTFLRPERLKAIALAEARRTTGLVIDAGPASVRLGFSGVVLRVSDLRVAVADSSQILRVERADATLKTRPLLRRQMELSGLALHRPDLQVRPPALGAAGATGARRNASSPFLAFLAVESWSVREGSYGQRGPEGEFALTGVDLSGGFSWRAGKGASGSIRGRAAAGSWKAPALSLVLPPLDAAIDFRLSAAADSLTLPRVELSSGALKLALAGAFRPAGRVWIGSLTGRAEPFSWNDVEGLIPPAFLSGRFEIPELRIERTVREALLISGLVRSDSMIARGHTLNDVSARARWGLGGLLLEDLKASVYGGSATGNVAVVPVDGGAAFTHHGNLALRGVDLGGALAEWFPIGRRLEGTGRADLIWTGRAGPGLDPLRSIDLSGAFLVENGAVLDVSGLAELAEALHLEGAVGGRWPFRRLAADLAVREGRVTVDTLRVTQDGIGWILFGSVGFDGRLDLSGIVRADPKRVALPPEVALFAPYLAEGDGRIPIDFRVAGMLAEPTVVLDWKAIGKRAGAKAHGG